MLKLGEILEIKKREENGNWRFKIEALAPVLARLLTEFLGEEFMFKDVSEEYSHSINSSFGCALFSEIDACAYAVGCASLVKNITEFDFYYNDNLILLKEDTLFNYKSNYINFYLQNKDGLAINKKFKCGLYPCIKNFMKYVINFAIENDIRTFNLNEGDLNNLLDEYLVGYKLEDREIRTRILCK